MTGPELCEQSVELEALPMIPKAWRWVNGGVKLFTEFYHVMNTKLALCLLSSVGKITHYH